MDRRPTSPSARSAGALQERLIAFAVGACGRARQVRRDPATIAVIEQLARAATSPAANYAEACAARSRRDFLHKMHICLGELRETRALLILLDRLDPHETPGPIAECDELIAIFVTSIRTATRGLRKGT